MDIIIALRIAITLTFLILAVGGPIAIWQLRTFTALYYLKHRELQARVEQLEQRLNRQEPGNGEH
jgi:hypothetical protein